MMELQAKVFKLYICMAFYAGDAVDEFQAVR
jgi:hypothetical protein